MNKLEEQQKEFCERYGITMEQFRGEAKIPGSLDLKSVEEIPQGFNPTVGGWLNLRNAKAIPQGFNPTVGGSLDLESVTSIPEGFNPTVGGWLDLRNAKAIPQGFNPTVGGSLYLPEQFRHMVNNKQKPDFSKPFEWLDGKFILADGIMTEVLSKHGNVSHVRKVGAKPGETMYLVTDGEGRYAHGETIKEAKESLIYKIKNRDKSEYESLTLDSKVTFQYGIEMYRVITGACAAGVRDFVESNAVAHTDYTVAQIIEMTRGKYGHAEFKTFFAGK